MVGPRTMSTPLRRASSADTTPYRGATARAQDDESAGADGGLSDGSRSSQTGPRTPLGPSDRTIDRSPIPGSGWVDQKSCPVRSLTFSSSVRRPRRPVSSAGVGLMLATVGGPHENRLLVGSAV